jgi:hypothetical protein
MLLPLWMAATVAGVQLDRVEVLADDPGTLVSDELPLLLARPGGTGLRFLAQAQPVVRFGDHFTLGTSLVAITPGWEVRPSERRLGGLVAMPTRLGLPAGLVVAGTVRTGPLWLDLGLRASSGASWVAPKYGDLRVGPTLGVAWVPKKAREL